MKGRELIKRGVVSLSEAAEIGKVENIVFDREARLAALVIRKRNQHKEEMAATTVTNVHALGQDAITIDDSDRVEGSETVGELHSFPSLRQLVGCRVITEGGTYLGMVRDLLLDPVDRRITDFEIATRGFLGRVRGDTIPATGHLRFGRSLVIVPNTVALKGKAVLEEVEDETAPQPVPADLPQPIGLRRLPEQASATTDSKVGENNDKGELTRAVGG